MFGSRMRDGLSHSLVSTDTLFEIDVVLWIILWPTTPYVRRFDDV